jgi:hypothetical protein
VLNCVSGQLLLHPKQSGIFGGGIRLGIIARTFRGAKKAQDLERARPARTAPLVVSMDRTRGEGIIAVPLLSSHGLLSVSISGLDCDVYYSATR